MVSIGFAVDATSVYWSNGIAAMTGSVMKARKAGAHPVVLASGLSTVGTILAVGATSVYWANITSGAPPAFACYEVTRLTPK